VVNTQIAEERLEDSWVPLDETVAPEELEEMIRSKEVYTNAVILESVSPGFKSKSAAYTLSVQY
jgi:peptidyl-prolyl cis-trans isomerase-like 4